MCEHSGNSSSSSTPCTPFPASSIPNNTWPNLQESIQFERAASAIINDRPHTISSGKTYTRDVRKVSVLNYCCL